MLHVQKQLFASVSVNSGGYLPRWSSWVNIHRYSPPLRRIIVNCLIECPQVENPGRLILPDWGDWHKQICSPQGCHSRSSRHKTPKYWKAFTTVRIVILLTLSLPRSKKYILPTFSREMPISQVVRVNSIIIIHLSKLWKAKFSLLCDVIFLVGLEGKFDIDHSQEWKG